MTEISPAEPTELQIQVALQGVAESKTFAVANRLKSFLRYIVEETLAGRGPNIRAKLIASDVYGRRPEDGVEQEAIVRVDAGRLRRRLDVYYSDEGKNDRVRIHVLSGGYIPTFEVVQFVEPEPTVHAERVGSKNSTVFLAALLAIGCFAFALGWFSRGVSNDLPPTEFSVVASSAAAEERIVRSSVNQVSSASLLARTFVEDARALTFPSIDKARLEAAEILCQRAIELSPELSTGHSCDAFAQAYLAFIMPEGNARDSRLLRAEKEAASALRIDPADAYAQMANAWTRFVGGQRKTAIDRARAAIGIEPEEDFLRNFYGMMMTFDGQGAELVLSSFPEVIGVSPLDRYHPFILAGAVFQMGNYAGAIEAIEAAVEIEGRTSALITAIRIAAHESLGNEIAAKAYAVNLATSWPGANYENLLLLLFSHEADALEISTRVDSVINKIGDQ